MCAVLIITFFWAFITCLLLKKVRPLTFSEVIDIGEYVPIKRSITY